MGVDTVDIPKPRTSHAFTRNSIMRRGSGSIFHPAASRYNDNDNKGRFSQKSSPDGLKDMIITGKKDLRICNEKIQDALDIDKFSTI